MKGKFLTHEEIAKYPKSVILAAIERRTLVMPTLHDLEYVAWESEMKAAIEDMNAAIAANDTLGSLPADATYEQYEKHHRQWMKNSDDFDRAQVRINAANKRWEKFTDEVK